MAIKTERSRFEAWFAMSKFSMVIFPHDQIKGMLWDAWQARAALLAAPRTEDTKGQSAGVLPNTTTTNADPEQQNEVKPT